MASILCSSPTKQSERVSSIKIDSPSNSPRKGSISFKASTDKNYASTEFSRTAPLKLGIEDYEKQEIMKLLKDVPKRITSIHKSYHVIPWAYQILQKVLSNGIHEEPDKAKMDFTSNGECLNDSEIISDVIPEDLSKDTKRKVYEMVILVQMLFEELQSLLEESKFFWNNSEMYGYESLVVLMTFNFIQNKFTVKPPPICVEVAVKDFGISEAMMKVAKALWKHQIKLSSTFAKKRVEKGTSEMVDFLTGSKREYLHLMNSLPQHARVAKPGYDLSPYFKSLEKSGYYRASTEEHLRVIPRLDSRHSKSFSACHHNEDTVIAFGPSTPLEEVPLIKEDQLIIQDLPSWNAVERFKHELKDLTDCDLLVTHAGRGEQALHIASSFAARNVTVTIFGCNTEIERLILAKAASLDLKNVSISKAPFCECDPTDEVYDNVKAIFCCPPNSLSAVASPVNFIMQEEDKVTISLLKLDRGSAVEARKYTVEQVATVKHALKFRRCEKIAYFVRTQLMLETEDVLKTAILEANKESNKLEEERETAGKSLTNSKKTKKTIKRKVKDSYEVKYSNFLSFLGTEEGKSLSIDYGYFMGYLGLKSPSKQAANSVIAKAIEKGLITLESSNTEELGGLTIHKPKKYKHRFMKPTLATEAKQSNAVLEKDFEFSLRKYQEL